MEGFLFSSRLWSLIQPQPLPRLGDERRPVRVHVEGKPLARDPFERVSGEEAQQREVVLQLRQDGKRGVAAPFAPEHLDRDHLLVWFAASERCRQHVHVEAWPVQALERAAIVAPPPQSLHVSDQFTYRLVRVAEGAFERPIVLYPRAVGGRADAVIA